MDVSWKVMDQDVSGEGLVMNISSSGLLLQTDRIFRPSDDCVLSIESGGETFPFASKKARIVWFERIRAAQDKYKCGLQFIEDQDNQFKEWLEEKINRLSAAGDANILGNLAY